MSLAGPSNYQVLRMEKSDNNNPQSIGVEGKTIAFNYFESLYSPNITADATIVDTGDSVVDNKGNLATIKDGFPLEHDGSETLTFRIANENGTLTSLKPLIVTSSPITFDQSTRQILTLDLRSKFAIDSSNNPRLGTYGIGTVDESVKKILIENKKSNFLSLKLILNLYFLTNNQIKKKNGISIPICLSKKIIGNCR